MKTLKQMTDERLSALTWDTAQGMRRIRTRERASASRPRRTAAFVLAAALALAATTALAVGLRMSQTVAMKRTARQCLMDTYGLDEKTITMFTEHAQETDSGWEITYSYWQPNVGGVYTVQVDRAGRAQADWSLAGQEGAWSQAEIAAYMELEKQAYQDGLQQEPAPTATPAPTHLSEAQVLRAAQAVMRERWQMTDKALEALLPNASYENGVWSVAYNCVFWPEGPEKIGVYEVRLYDADGSVLDAAWSLDGTQAGCADREALAQAQSYDVQCLEWVADYVALYQTGWEEWPMDPETSARLDAMMIEMGFDPTTYNHILPGEGDLALEQARELAYEAIHSEYGVTREQYEASSFAYADLTQTEDRHVWYFWLQNAEEVTGWTVLIDAQTSEILDLFCESFAAGNG